MVTVAKISGLRSCSLCRGEFGMDGFHSKSTSYCRACNLQYLKRRRHAARDLAETHTLVHGKTCIECGVLKAAPAFAASNREQDRYCARCLDCQAQLKATRVRRRGKGRDWKKQKYGMSIREFDRMLSAQQHACVICRKPHSSDKPLCVDHEHASGRVRGLLCGHCNTAIGYLRDNPMFCRLAAEYLETA